MSSKHALPTLLTSIAALTALNALSPQAVAGPKRFSHPPAPEPSSLVASIPAPSSEPAPSSASASAPVSKPSAANTGTPAATEGTPGTEPRQTDKPDVWAGNGVAVHLSGGLGMITPSLTGGGAMLALTFEQGGFGFGAYGSGVGATSAREVDGARLSAARSMLGAGALVHWTPGDSLVLPLLELGLGYGSLGLADEQTNIHKGKGAMLMLRAGIATHKTGLFVALRIDAPLFKAEDTRGNTDPRYGVGITAETGFRFGG